MLLEFGFHFFTAAFIPRLKEGRHESISSVLRGCDQTHSGLAKKEAEISSQKSRNIPDLLLWHHTTLSLLSFWGWELTEIAIRQMQGFYALTSGCNVLQTLLPRGRKELE